MESVHGVVIEVKQRKTTGGGSDDPMQNYLQGEGNRLRRGIRKRKREEPESEPETDSETELHSSVSEKAIKEENERLRQQVRKMQEEMRLARAAFEAELQGVERRHRIELDEVLEAFDINNNDQAVRDQLKTLREKLQSRYENEIKILQNRHGKNERRLWNLLKG
ncbi:hypothetical protein BR93DRAFT_972265 [Coniochaeta sp. PMI_546]|nr:hypothetical protein BR93DRAFT_972265 [Coniochaeta sp. PMI_546]